MDLLYLASYLIFITCTIILLAWLDPCMHMHLQGIISLLKYLKLITAPDNGAVWYSEGLYDVIAPYTTSAASRQLCCAIASTVLKPCNSEQSYLTTPWPVE